MKTIQRINPCLRSAAIGGLIPLFIAGVWLAAAPPAKAQTSEPAVPACVASVLDEGTVAVIGVETTRVDLDAAITQVSAIPILSERQRGDLAIHKRHLSVWLDHFHRAGGREIWIVATLADNLLGEAPFVVVPLAEGANRETIESLFAVGKLAAPRGLDFPFIAGGVLERDGGLIFGSDRALKRLRDFRGPTRAIPKSALEAVGGSEIRAFVLPTDDQRRVLSEFLRDPPAERRIVEQMPSQSVPAEFRRNPGEIARLALADGLQWLAAGVTTRAPLSFQLVIGSKDSVSARALELWMAGAWRYVQQNVAGDKSSDSQMLAGLIDQLSRLLAPQVAGDRLTIRVNLQQLMASAAGAYLGRAAVGIAKGAEESVVKNHLKQLALAMHNYHDVFKRFPPAAIRDAQGRPLLSWRVALLPFVEENKLYKQFHLDEPWDSPHNKPLVAMLPDVFAPQSAQLRSEGKTTLLVPIGKQTIFGPPEGVSILDITDGTSNTILIVDADEDQAVVWTKPDDLNVDGVDAKQAIFGQRKDRVFCAFADGAVQRLDPEMTTQLARALLTRNGGEAIPRK